MQSQTSLHSLRWYVCATRDHESNGERLRAIQLVSCRNTPQFSCSPGSGRFRAPRRRLSCPEALPEADRPQRRDAARRRAQTFEPGRHPDAMDGA